MHREHRARTYMPTALRAPTGVCPKRAPPHNSIGTCTEGMPLRSSFGARIEHAPLKFSSDDERAQRLLSLHLPYANHEVQHFLNTYFDVCPPCARSSTTVEARAPCAPQQQFLKCAIEERKARTNLQASAHARKLNKRFLNCSNHFIEFSVNSEISQTNDYDGNPLGIKQNLRRKD